MRRSARPWLWWIAVVLLACGSLATLSRTSVLMLVAVVATFLWLRPRETRRLWPLLLPGDPRRSISPSPGRSAPLKGSFLPEGGLIAEQQSNPGSRGQGRIADLGPSLREVAHQPLVGQGYATRVADRPGPSDQILDDQWLGILMETGLVGFIGWLWLVGRAVRRSRECARSGTRRAAAG